jgi:hypothetical protein
LRILIAIGALTLALSAAVPASAQYDQREYRRGYRDCLAGRYDEDHGHGYGRGCRDAQRERGDEAGGMDERPHYRPEPVPAPVAPIGPVGIPRVVGMNSMQAVGAMASRGYRNVGTSIVGGGVFGIYFNPMTRECVQLANAQGRVVDAREIGSHPQCR